MNPIVFISCMVCAFVLTYFRPPSADVSEDKLINDTVKILNSNKITIAEKIDFVEKNLNIIKERTNEKIKRFTFLIFLTLTAFISYIKLQRKPDDFLTSNLFLFSVIFIIIAICTVCYKRASEILFDTLQAACYQQKLNILIN